MKTHWMIGSLIVLISTQLFAAVPEGQEVPTKWFKKAKGYEEALALQKETGADILVYIRNVTDKSKKGLCNWFESKSLKSSAMSKFVRNEFIKVELAIPGSKETVEVAESLRMNKGPTLVVINPSGRKHKINPFEWPNNKPKLKDPNDVIEELKAKSTPF